MLSSELGRSYMSEWPCSSLEANVARLRCGSQRLTLQHPKYNFFVQVQVLAVLGSLSGISYPSRIQVLISVAKLANLDLVRSAATCNKLYDVESW
jgi:hypothetical protein